MVELSLLFQPAQSIPHLSREIRGNVQRVVSRKNPPGGEGGNHFQRGQVGLRVGGGVVGEQGVQIDQVAGVQRAPLLLPEAQVPRGVARRVEGLDSPPAQVQHFPAL